MESQTQNLNEDTQVFGVVTHSSVSHPTTIQGRPKPIYSVTIKIDPGLAHSVGLMYLSCLGPDCVNYEETGMKLMNARELTFETIQKPLVSGINPDTEEFDHGTHVRVSCRFEAVDGELTADGRGIFKHPRLMLRFVDADWSQEPEALPDSDPEVISHYDF